MHKIDGSGNSNGTFVNEDNNLPPTEVTAAWLNAVQSEIVNVILGANIVLAKADNTQLKQALDKLYKPNTAIAAGTADALNADFAPYDLLLVHGQSFYVRAIAANTAVAPTLAVDSSIAKAIVKGNNLPLVAGDIAGAGYWCLFNYDATLDKFILINPAKGTIPIDTLPVGTIIDYSGSSAPSGFLACPTSVTNISRATYANLFNAIGTAWGAGDGATTFGMPYFPADYAAIQASGNVASKFIGQMPSHLHGYATHNNTSGIPGVTASGTRTGTANTDAAGSGTDNFAAGMRVLKCVKF